MDCESPKLSAPNNHKGGADDLLVCPSLVWPACNCRIRIDQFPFSVARGIPPFN